MPKLETLRKFYPKTILTDEELKDLAEWVRKRLGKNHISPKNIVLDSLISYIEEFKIK